MRTLAHNPSLPNPLHLYQEAILGGGAGGNGASMMGGMAWAINGCVLVTASQHDLWNVSACMCRGVTCLCVCVCWCERVWACMTT